jgi:cell shape-determining protein MreC
MAIGLAFLFVVPQKASDRMQLSYARVFRWPLSASRGLTLAARSTALPREVDAKPSQEIQNIIANLQAKLQEATRQNAELTKLHAAPGWENIPLLLAPVFGPADQEWSELIIGRGTTDGLAVGQFVMSPGSPGVADQSIIGTISGVDAKTARVRLITAPYDPKGSKDSKAARNAKTARDAKAPDDPRIVVSIGSQGIQSLMEGQGGNTARILFVDKNKHTINKGDPVYAQKAPGLDVPTITAKVKDCRPDRDNPLFWDITVEPVCDIAGLREVAVVVAGVAAQ